MAFKFSTSRKHHLHWFSEKENPQASVTKNSCLLQRLVHQVLGLQFSSYLGLARPLGSFVKCVHWLQHAQHKLWLPIAGGDKKWWIGGLVRKLSFMITSHRAASKNHHCRAKSWTWNCIQIKLVVNTQCWSQWDRSFVTIIHPINAVTLLEHMQPAMVEGETGRTKRSK